MEFPFACIHIAGTNGKGSTAAYIGSILQAAGHTCGVYTSPHVVHPSERIRVNGKNIPSAEMDRLMAIYGPKAKTFFHAYTDAAFAWFCEQKADYAVLETGLGGRCDPTNAADPKVAVLTGIGLDHMQILGDTVEKITFEKCGIIKPGVPAFSAPQRPEALAVIREQCAIKNSPLYVLSDSDIALTERSLIGQRFDFNCRGTQLKDLYIPMLSLRQPENAALAAAVCLKCGISPEHIRAGLANTQIEARFEYHGGAFPLVLDGAHNVDSANELARTLKMYFVGKRIVLLTAIMRDKDIDGILDIFAGFANEAVTVQAEEVRGAEAKTLAEGFRKRGIPAYAAKTVAEAYDKAVALAREKNGLLVTAGSFYLVGRVKELHLF